MVLDALYLTGATRVMLSLARLWPRREMRVLVRKHLPDRLTVAPTGLDVRYLSPREPSARWTMPGSLLRLIRAARRADVVVVGSEIGMVVLIGFVASRFAHRPFVVSVHANLDLTLVQWVAAPLRPLFRAVHRRADGAVVVEQALVGQLERNGLPLSRIRVVRNGIDLAGVRAAAHGPDPLSGITGPRVVTTGRLSFEKGNDVAIRAHARTVTDQPHTLVVLNDGPEQEALRGLAEQLGVADTVVFAGRMVPHPVVARSDAFILPSRHEGLPLSLLEAMAVGTPVIAAECSDGVVEALEHGRCGALVPVDDAVALASVLRHHLREPAHLRERADAAGAEIHRFSDTAMAEGWSAAIGDFVHDWRRPSRSVLSRGEA